MQELLSWIVFIYFLTSFKDINITVIKALVSTHIHTIIELKILVP